MAKKWSELNSDLKAVAKYQKQLLAEHLMLSCCNVKQGHAVWREASAL